MELKLKITAGRVYHCPVCGAEVTVVLFGGGSLAPVCCNQPMAITNVICAIYSCPVCGAEITVIKKENGVLKPRCCNRPMTLRLAAA
jgi:desulfoferrodoxin-like iron-binding protein